MKAELKRHALERLFCCSVAATGGVARDSIKWARVITNSRNIKPSSTHFTLCRGENDVAETLYNPLSLKVLYHWSTLKKKKKGCIRIKRFLVVGVNQLRFEFDIDSVEMGTPVF